jgi:hypothetical protein
MIGGGEEMNIYVRILFSILIPLSFVIDGLGAKRLLPGWGALTIICIVYMLIVWRDKNRWTWMQYAGAVGVMCADFIAAPI